MTEPAAPTPEALRVALQRLFTRARTAGPTSPLVASHAGIAADVAMSVVTTYLEAFRAALAAEIAGEIEAGVCEPGESCDRRFCPDCTRYGQAMTDAAIARRVGGMPGKSGSEEGERDA